MISELRRQIQTMFCCNKYFKPCQTWVVWWNYVSFILILDAVIVACNSAPSANRCPRPSGGVKVHGGEGGSLGITRGPMIQYYHDIAIFGVLQNHILRFFSRFQTANHFPKVKTLSASSVSSNMTHFSVYSSPFHNVLLHIFITSPVST